MYLFIDLETTGLDPNKDSILEVGWIFTNERFDAFTLIDSYVCDVPDSALARLLAEPDVLNMHRESRLLKDIQEDETRLRIEDIEDLILGEIAAWAYDGERVNPAGFSVHFDVNFIRVHMPRLYAKLHHQICDISTLRNFFKLFDFQPDIENHSKHRAASDVIEALDYAKKFRNYMEKNNA